jgi:hypothetical protein
MLLYTGIANNKWAVLLDALGLDESAAAARRDGVGTDCAQNMWRFRVFICPANCQ